MERGAGIALHERHRFAAGRTHCCYPGAQINRRFQLARRHVEQNDQHDACCRGTSCRLRHDLLAGDQLAVISVAIEQLTVRPHRDQSLLVQQQDAV
jgi:hypothetical protein